MNLSKKIMGRYSSKSFKKLTYQPGNTKYLSHIVFN